MLRGLKCLFLLLLLAGTLLHASDSRIAAQIIDKTLESMFNGAQVRAWADTEEQKAIIEHSKKMTLAGTPLQADFLLVAEQIPAKLKSGSIIFATDYDMLFEDKRVIGAFYWQKGRPNLVFLRDRLKDNNLSLEGEFEKYIEDDL